MAMRNLHTCLCFYVNIRLNKSTGLKVACRVQIWKKKFVKIVCFDKFGYSFIKNEIIFMYIPSIYKKNIILSLFKIDALNVTMYIFTILTCPLIKIYVTGLHNLISMNISSSQTERLIN